MQAAFQAMRQPQTAYMAEQGGSGQERGQLMLMRTQIEPANTLSIAGRLRARGRLAVS
jgi:hypothetical protein